MPNSRAMPSTVKGCRANGVSNAVGRSNCSDSHTTRSDGVHGDGSPPARCPAPRRSAGMTASHASSPARSSHAGVTEIDT